MERERERQREKERDIERRHRGLAVSSRRAPRLIVALPFVFLRVSRSVVIRFVSSRDTFPSAVNLVHLLATATVIATANARLLLNNA